MYQWTLGLVLVETEMKTAFDQTTRSVYPVELVKAAGVVVILSTLTPSFDRRTAKYYRISSTSCLF